MGKRKTPPEVKRYEQAAAAHMGRRLKYYRKRKLWSLYDVQRMTGIRASSLSDYERGKYLCPRDRLRMLADLYQAPLDEFYYREEINLKEEVRRISDRIDAWPEDQQSKIIEAILKYIESLEQVFPPRGD